MLKKTQKLKLFNNILLPLFIAVIVFSVQGGKYPIDTRNNAVWHDTRGINYLQQGYYEAAAEEFSLAIDLKPNSTETASFYNNLGTSYMQLRVYDRAAWAYKNAIVRDPNCLLFYQNLIRAYKAKKELKKQLNIYYKNAVKHDNSSSWLIAGLISYELKQYPSSYSYISRFIKKNPDLYLSKTMADFIKTYKGKK